MNNTFLECWNHVQSSWKTKFENFQICILLICIFWQKIVKKITIWRLSLWLISSCYRFGTPKCFFLMYNSMLNPKMADLMRLDWPIFHKLSVFTITLKFHILIKIGKNGFDPKRIITQIWKIYHWKACDVSCMSKT